MLEHWKWRSVLNMLFSAFLKLFPERFFISRHSPPTVNASVWLLKIHTVSKIWRPLETICFNIDLAWSTVPVSSIVCLIQSYHLVFHLSPIFFFILWQCRTVKITSLQAHNNVPQPQSLKVVYYIKTLPAPLLRCSLLFAKQSQGLLCNTPL